MKKKKRGDGDRSHLSSLLGLSLVVVDHRGSSLSPAADETEPDSVLEGAESVKLINDSPVVIPARDSSSGRLPVRLVDSVKGGWSATLRRCTRGVVSHLPVPTRRAASRPRLELVDSGCWPQ